MDFVGKWRWFFGFSGFLILAGIISFGIPPSMVLGIDFTGGTTMTVVLEEPVGQEELRGFLSEQGHEDATIQAAGEDRYFIRTRPLEAVEGEVSARQQLEQALDEEFGLVETPQFTEVSPTIAQETVRNAAIAVAAAAVGILLYVTWAFRRVPSPFRYGVAAIIALVHDILIVLGVFSIMGKLIGAQVDSVVITALLAVVGYSVNDTIVVFDRIRENIQRTVARDFGTVVNISLAETLGRSLNTSITILLSLLALLLLGGPTIRDFVLVFLVGTLAGTYSSIGIASQVLVLWEQRGLRRMLRGVLPIGAR